MMINKQRLASKMTRLALAIAVMAGMLGTQACKQSAPIAKQSEQIVRIEAITVPTVMPDVMPVFPGGENALMDFISRNLSYPSSAMEQGIEGRVNLRYLVDIDGSIKNVVVVKGIDPACDNEAVRVIKRMPKWTPGQKNGVNIPVYYNIPILFKLNIVNR